MIRFVAGLCSIGVALFAQTSSGFGSYPFDEWSAVGSQNRIDWSVVARMNFAGNQTMDDLERVLRPMGARIFHIWSPKELRGALAEILKEIAAR